MANLELRPLVDKAAQRAAYDITRVAQHNAPVSDGEWQFAHRLYEAGLGLGAYLDGSLSGTANLLPSTLAVPGGGTLPVAAATHSGVRADRTRRGIFRELMRARLELAAASGFAIVANMVSEATIYGRFGHGAATRTRAVQVRDGARIRDTAPSTGTIRILTRPEAIEQLPKVYGNLGAYRPGVLERSPGWWAATWEAPLRAGQHLHTIVHSGPSGDDGYAVYRTLPNSEPGGGVTLMVIDMHAANPGAVAGLWRFLLRVDLVDEVCARRRPTDELLEGLLTNWRHCRTHSLDDELWLRIVDGPAALAARTYAVAEPVVLEVTDPFRPNTSGRFRITPDGAEATDEPAGLALDVDALGMAYLGTFTFTTLAGIGRIRVHDEKALLNADRLFAAESNAFCGTIF
jgi:predicted acetyltransferase